jgi:UDP-glucose 4-epimerase
MKVLVSGAGGFLGRYVVERLLQGSHSVRAIVRPVSPKPSWAAGVEVFYADLRVHDNLVAAFEGIDAVLHVAAATSGNEDVQFASTVVATERFLNAMSHSAVKRLVLVSSLVVYDWTRANGSMDETTPLLRNPYDMGAYTIAKVWQERVVSALARTHGWDLTIMRPGFMWGPSHAEIAGMGRRFGPLQLMFGPLSRLPLSHVVNCADALVAAIESQNSAGETFNVIDGDDIRVWRYAREYARRSGRGGVPLPLPYGVGLGIAQCASLVSRMLFGKKGKLPSLLTPPRFQQQFKPLRFSNKVLREKLAWTPPLDFDDCLRETYAREKSAE